MTLENPNVFTHLHCHDETSILDGMTKISELPSRVKELGMSCIAQTNHGSLAGSYEFVKQCKKDGVKPICGIEVYFAEDRTIKEKDELDNNYYHLILLAQNNEGLKNLFKLNSRAWEDGFYHKGRIDDRLLEEYGDNLLVTSACLGGRIAQLFEHGNRSLAERKILYYKDLFPGRFFLELQTHNLPEQKHLNAFLLEMSRKFDIPAILTGDCHYLRREDGVERDSIHELLLGVQTGKTIADEKKFTFDGRHHWVKSPQEVLADLEAENLPLELLTNTKYVADMCTGEYFLDKKDHMPKLLGVDAGKELEKKAKWGLVKRFGSVEKVPQEYKDRLSYEIAMIKQMGFPDYFLIVEDFISWAKQNKVPIGAGRGSVAGSLVAWALGLTAKACDPIKAGLYFERFLSPGRFSMEITEYKNLEIDKNNLLW